MSAAFLSTVLAGPVELSQDDQNAIGVIVIVVVVAVGALVAGFLALIASAARDVARRRRSSGS